MINLKKLSLLGAVVLGLSACEMSVVEKYAKGISIENFPYKIGGSAAGYEQASLNCEVAAANAVPQNISAHTTPSWTTTAYTSCYAGSCYTTGGDTWGGDLVISDENDGLRSRYYAQCMANQGWGYVNIPPCPEGTTTTMLAGLNNYPRIGRNLCYIPASETNFHFGNLK